METAMFLQYPRESIRYFHSVLSYGHVCGPLYLISSLAILALVTADAAANGGNSGANADAGGSILDSLLSSLGVGGPGGFGDGSLGDALTFLCVLLRTAVSLAQTPVRYGMSFKIWRASRHATDADAGDALIAMKNGRIWRTADRIGRLVQSALLVSAALALWLLLSPALSWLISWLPAPVPATADAVAALLAALATACARALLAPVTALASLLLPLLLPPGSTVPPGSAAATLTATSVANAAAALLKSPVLAPFFTTTTTVASITTATATASASAVVTESVVELLPASSLLRRALVLGLIVGATNYAVSLTLLWRLVLAPDQERHGGPLLLTGRAVASRAQLREHVLTARTGAMPASVTRSLGKEGRVRAIAIEGLSNSNASASTGTGNTLGLSAGAMRKRAARLARAAAAAAGNISNNNSNSNDSSRAPTATSTSAKEDEAALPFLSTEGDACSICFGGFGFAASASLLRCGHLFHAACIARWLQQAATCPACHYELGADWAAGARGRPPFAGVDPVAVAAADAAIARAETEAEAEAEAAAKAEAGVGQSKREAFMGCEWPEVLEMANQQRLRQYQQSQLRQQQQQQQQQEQEQFDCEHKHDGCDNNDDVSDDSDRDSASARTETVESELRKRVGVRAASTADAVAVAVIGGFSAE